MTTCKHNYVGTEVTAYWDAKCVIGVDVSDECHADVYGSYFCAN